MKGIKINVSNNIAQITEKPQRIIAGTVGLPVEYTFDSHWDGLVKYAVFAAGKKLMMFEIENTAVIPWEVLRKPGQQLMIGVYGEHPDGTEALPTVWANAGVIRHGAVPGTAPGIPSPPPVWESIKNSIGELDELNTEHKETLVGAINEVEEAIRTEVPLIANRVSTPSGYGFDKTYAEIKEAVAAGRTILLNNYDVLYAMSDSGPNYYKFLPFVTANTDVSKPGLRVNSSDVWSEVATGAEPMTEEKVKALIEENAPEGITEETVLDLIKNNASGGGLLVTVTATQTDPGSYSYSMDSDYATIKAEVDEGKEVIIRCQRTHDKQTGYQYYMYHRLIDPGMLGFMSLSTQDGTYELMGINVLNNVHITTYDMPVLKTTAQELTEYQKAQVRKNIGAGTADEWSDLGESVTNLGDTLTWDGNTEGKVVVDTGTGMTLVKLSDSVLTSEDLVNGIMVTAHSLSGDYDYDVGLTGEQAQSMMQEDGFGMLQMVVVVPYDNYDAGGIVIPEAGLYVMTTADAYARLVTLSGYNFLGKAIKPVPEKYLPDSVKGGGVSSWNDLTDKPFGDEEVVILEEQVVSIQDGVAILELETFFVEGEEGTVKFDGVEYPCTATALGVGVFVGNLAIAGEEADTGEPFLIFEQMPGVFICAVSDTAKETATLEIKAKKATKIPDKYYEPAAVFYYQPGQIWLYTDAAATIKATVEDIIEEKTKRPILIASVYKDVCCSAVYIHSGLGYGRLIAVSGLDDDGAPQYKSFYTAEYTAT